MGNPFTTGGFNCCTCPEPPDYDPSVDPPLATYINRCGCPSVAVVCESSEKDAEMCGVVDPDDDPSIFYTTRTTTGEVNRYIDGPEIATTTFSRDGSGNCTNATNTTGSENCEGFQSGSTFYEKRVITASASGTTTGACGGTASATSPLPTHTSTKTYSAESGCGINYSETTPDATITIGTSCDFPCEPSSSGGLGFGQAFSGSGTVPFDWLDRIWEGTITGSVTIDETCDGGGTSTSPATFNVSAGATQATTFEDALNQTGTEGSEYTIPDTEQDALDAATAISGTSCSSLYQLRTNSSSFIKRTVTYSATATNLVVGVAYEGCVRIRKRESYSGTPPAGANTEWEDVEPDTISSFTATDTEEEVATDVDVPNAQGYEYEVVSAHVWASSAGCDCPTSYTP